MKTVVIDILHPAHLNLFKGIINDKSNGINFIVICINRGKLPLIVKEEINSVPVKIIGKHRGTFFSIIFEANIIRFFQIFSYLLFKKVDIGLSFGSFILGAVLKLKGTKNYHLSDDPERKLNAILENLTCNKRYLPPFVESTGKVKIFNALKEWAYLSPQYFKPNVKIIEELGLKQKTYIFVREVSTGSLNYLGQEKNIVASFSNDFPAEYEVVLSLEDKSTINQYPEHWKLLKEPIKDIHSIMYYSKLVVSSGDSMAREGGMLGVPSVYFGFREMKANSILIDKGILLNLKPTDAKDFFANLAENEVFKINQDEFRNKLKSEWVDMNQFLLDIINQ